MDRYREEDSQQSWTCEFSSLRNLRHNFLHVSNTQGLFIRLLWLNIIYHFNCKTYPWSDWKQETKTSCSKIKVQSPFSPSCILFSQWLRMEHWLNVVGTYRRVFSLSNAQRAKCHLKTTSSSLPPHFSLWKPNLYQTEIWKYLVRCEWTCCTCVGYKNPD